MEPNPLQHDFLKLTGIVALSKTINRKSTYMAEIQENNWFTLSCCKSLISGGVLHFKRTKIKSHHSQQKDDIPKSS